MKDGRVLKDSGKDDTAKETSLMLSCDEDHLSGNHAAAPKMGYMRNC